MTIAFVTFSSRAALLLDEGGICRWVVERANATSTADHELLATMRRQCVGAQFVASLDPTVEGCLLHVPKVGTHLLLTRIVEGRVTLVRFGPLRRFVELDAPSAVEDVDTARALADRLLVSDSPVETEPEPETDPLAALPLVLAIPGPPPMPTLAELPWFEPLSAPAPMSEGLGVISEAPWAPRVAAEMDAPWTPRSLVTPRGGALAYDVDPSEILSSDLESLSHVEPDEPSVRPSGFGPREGTEASEHEIATSQFSHVMMGDMLAREKEAASSAALLPRPLRRRLG